MTANPQQPNKKADIKNKEKEIDRWRGTIKPQAEYLCETMDKMDFSSSASAAKLIVDYMDKYISGRIAREVYTSVTDISFDPAIVPYRMSFALNIEYIDSQPYRESYIQNIIGSIQQQANSFMPGNIQFRLKSKTSVGFSTYYKSLVDAVSISSQIVKNGFYKDRGGFKVRAIKNGVVELEVVGEVTQQEMLNCVKSMKEEQKKIISPSSNAQKGKNLH